MMNNLNTDPAKNVYKLPEIKAKYSSMVVSKVVSITFGIIALFLLVSFVIVSTVSIDVTIDATGQLEPTNLIYIHSPLIGEIKKIYVNGGITFHKGDLLVQFDSVKLSDQVEKLKSDLSISKINYEIKNKSIPYEITQNELQIKQAEAQLLKAKANLRQKMLDYFPGVNVDSFMVAYKKGTHITLDYAMAEIISSEASLQSVQSKQDVINLKSLELKSLLIEMNQSEVLIKRQSEYLRKTKLTAPYDGIVLTNNLENLEGMFVTEGSSLFEISHANDWKAILNVSEKDAYELVVGDSVKIEVRAMKQSDEYLLIPGKVVSVSAEPLKDKINQSSSGFYKVDVSIDTQDAEKYLKKFKRGFSIEARIIKDTDKIINILIKNIRKLI